MGWISADGTVLLSGGQEGVLVHTSQAASLALSEALQSDECAWAGSVVCSLCVTCMELRHSF